MNADVRSVHPAPAERPVEPRSKTRPGFLPSIGTLSQENHMSSPALSHTRSSAPPLQDDARHRPPRPRTQEDRSATTPRAAGRYRYDLKRGAWWWSPETFAVLGVPAAADASTELLLQHLNPEDRAATLGALTGACTENRAFTLRARIVRADGEQRAVVLVGEPDPGPDGGGVVDGVVVDLTDCPGPAEPPDRSSALEAEVVQMRAAMASRATIEQAKGILMLLTSCSDTVAFDLLTHISSHTHRKVRDVAESITESASGRAPLPDDVRAIIRDACPPPRHRR
jgi:hypothetical protein